MSADRGHFADKKSDAINRLDKWTDESIIKEIEGVDDSRQHSVGLTIQLNAYLGSALTGLNEMERKELFELQDLLKKICSSNGIKLYLPREVTDPVKNPTVVSEDVNSRDSEKVRKSDLFVLLTDHPSFGAGQELEIARSSMIPIIIIKKTTADLSRMVKGVPFLKEIVEYTNLDSLRELFHQTLLKFKTIMLQNKLNQQDIVIISDRIFKLLKERHLDLEDLSSMTKLGKERVEQILTLSDRNSNPSITELRAIASSLGTPVEELIRLPETIGTPQVIAARNMKAADELRLSKLTYKMGRKSKLDEFDEGSNL